MKDSRKESYSIIFACSQQFTPMGNHNYKHEIEPEQFNCEHPLFKQAIVAADHTHKYIQCKIPIQKEQFKQWSSKATKKEKNSYCQEYLLLPTKVSYEPDAGVCSNTGSAIVEYPFFETTLSQEITRRQKEKQQFKESQLWYLLYVLTAAKTEVSKHHQRLGDIKPANVFILPEQKVKIGNLLMSPNEKTNYYKFINCLHYQKDFMIAPEDFEEAKKDAIDNKSNCYSETFSIGSTVLSAGLLNNLQEMYDFTKLTFLQEKYKQLLLSWLNHPKYSDIFKAIILNLVSKTPQKRIDLEQLWKFISHYRISIEGKEPFIIVNPPACFEEAVQNVRSKCI